MEVVQILLPSRELTIGQRHCSACAGWRRCCSCRAGPPGGRAGAGAREGRHGRRRPCSCGGGGGRRRHRSRRPGLTRGGSAFVSSLRRSEAGVPRHRWPLQLPLWLAGPGRHFCRGGCWAETSCLALPGTAAPPAVCFTVAEQDMCCFLAAVQAVPLRWCAVKHITPTHMLARRLCCGFMQIKRESFESVHSRASFESVHSDPNEAKTYATAPAYAQRCAASGSQSACPAAPAWRCALPPASCSTCMAARQGWPQRSRSLSPVFSCAVPGLAALRRPRPRPRWLGPMQQPDQRPQWPTPSPRRPPPAARRRPPPPRRRTPTRLPPRGSLAPPRPASWAPAGLQTTQRCVALEAVPEYLVLGSDVIAAGITAFRQPRRASHRPSTPLRLRVPVRRRLPPPNRQRPVPLAPGTPTPSRRQSRRPRPRRRLLPAPSPLPR